MRGDREGLADRKGWTLGDRGPRADLKSPARRAGGNHNLNLRRRRLSNDDAPAAQGNDGPDAKVRTLDRDDGARRAGSRAQTCDGGDVRARHDAKVGSAKRLTKRLDDDRAARGASGYDHHTTIRRARPDLHLLSTEGDASHV